MFILWFLATVSTIMGGTLPKCNECLQPTKLNITDYKVEYVQCTFDTTFSVHINESVDWLFLGTACDDRCDIETVGEGYLCSNETPGYFEIEDGQLGDEIVKYEFHHFHCTIADNVALLHVHRFLPNFWIKNVSIPYYVSSGKGIPNITDPQKFEIVY
jgi:hypothetical protein